MSQRNAHRAASERRGWAPRWPELVRALLARQPATAPDHPGNAGSGPDGDSGSGAGSFTPGDLRVGARMVAAGSGLVAVLAVTGYPSEVGPGWLSPLLGYPGQLDVSIHVGPVDQWSAAQRLRRQLARLEAARRHNARHGQLPDPLVEAAAEDAHALAAALARGDGKLFRVGLYLAVHASDAEALRDEVEAVRALAASMLLDTRPVTWRQLPGWTTCLPLGLDELGAPVRMLDTAPLAAGFPFTSPDLPAPDPVTPAAPPGPLYGLNLGSHGLVCHDRWTQPNHNAVVLGWSGSGKSFFVKVEMLRHLYRPVAGRAVRVRVLDPADEYTRLTTALGGVVVRVGAPGVKLNPLDLPIHTRAGGGRHAPADAVRRRALFTETFLAVLLGEELTAVARAVLDQATATAYQRAGIHPDDPTTWGRPAPLLGDLAAALAAHPDPTGAELATRLHPYTHGHYRGLFDAPTQPVVGDEHLVAVSLRECPEELRAAATLLVLDRFWREVTNPAHRVPRMVIIDEAWQLMIQPSAARWVRRMAKEARKDWGALTFVTQDIGDVLGSELGMAVITNSATHILFHQAEQTIDRIGEAFALSAAEISFLRRAGVGEALLCAAGHRAALRVVASPAESALVTTSPAELAALAHTTSPGYVELDPSSPNPDPAHLGRRRGAPRGPDLGGSGRGGW